MALNSGNDRERDELLAKRYREAANESPPARLDAAIRAAARREAGCRRRRRTPQNRLPACGEVGAELLTHRGSGSGSSGARARGGTFTYGSRSTYQRWPKACLLVGRLRGWRRWERRREWRRGHRPRGWRRRWRCPHVEAVEANGAKVLYCGRV